MDIKEAQKVLLSKEPVEYHGMEFLKIVSIVVKENTKKEVGKGSSFLELAEVLDKNNRCLVIVPLDDLNLIRISENEEKTNSEIVDSKFLENNKRKLLSDIETHHRVMRNFLGRSDGQKEAKFHLSELLHCLLELNNILINSEEK